MISSRSLPIAILFGLLAYGAQGADAPDRLGTGDDRRTDPGGPAIPLNLECTSIRRLDDNFALDLKLRFVFNPRGRSYLRM